MVVSASHMGLWTTPGHCLHSGFWGVSHYRGTHPGVWTWLLTQIP